VTRSLLPLFVIALAVSAPAVATEIVEVPQFDAIELRGGGTVTVLPGPVERVAIVEGSSQVTRFHVERGGQLVIDTCNRDCPRSYRLGIEIRSPRVPDLAVDGGGRIFTSGGFAPQRHLSAAVNGGGLIDARAIEASNVSAAVNGGGELLVRSDGILSGAVNGGGHVTYWGNPRVTSAIQGGGSVRPGY
jgi:hypothetical protein